MFTKKFKSVKENLKIVHFPQLGNSNSITTLVPYVKGENIEKKTLDIVDAISKQYFLLHTKGFIADYNNMILVEKFNKETNQWEDYYNEKMGMNWEEVEDYFSNDKNKIVVD